MIFLTILLYFYISWILYVIIMGSYRAHLSERLSGFNKYMAIPLVLLGVLFDIVGNILIATILFLDIPRELLFTDRLKRYKNIEGTALRKRIALYICDSILDPFDPRNNHC